MQHRVGTSGYWYRHWFYRFYPRGTKPAQFLEFYAKQFDTVEINKTFYSDTPASEYQRWASRVPDSFRFAVKLRQTVTHEARLDCNPLLWLDPMRALGHRLGPVLVQLPARFKWPGIELLRAFAAQVPKDFRLVWEPRADCWLNPEFHAFLRDRNWAMCFGKKAYKSTQAHPWPAEVVTADWTYMRFHDRRLWEVLELYDVWGRSVARNASENWFFWNNDAHCNAVQNAKELREMLNHAKGELAVAKDPKALRQRHLATKSSAYLAALFNATCRGTLPPSREDIILAIVVGETYAAT